MKSIYSAFDCVNGDGEALSAISFFYALLKNEGLLTLILYFLFNRSEIPCKRFFISERLKLSYVDISFKF